jgi:hypothetical protein
MRSSPTPAAGDGADIAAVTSSRLIDTAPPLVLLRSPCSKEWGPRDWVRRFRRLVSATRGGTPAGADDLRFRWRRPLNSGVGACSHSCVAHPHATLIE